MDGFGSPMRLWAAVMDVTLEGARRVVDIVEGLHETSQEPQRTNLFLLVSSDSNGIGSSQEPFASGGGALATFGRKDWSEARVPLSLALVPLEPKSEGTAGPAGSSNRMCADSLAKGLLPTPLPDTIQNPALQQPGAQPQLAQIQGMQPQALQQQGGQPQGAQPLPLLAQPKEEDRVRRALYGSMALRPHSVWGGQLAQGLAPEHVALAEVRSLCCTILEMSCTLLCHFCQATRSSIMHSGERSAPASSVLHGLLNFLHQTLGAQQSNEGIGLDESTVQYMWQLDAALRSWQNLGLAEEGERLGDDLLGVDE